MMRDDEAAEDTEMAVAAKVEAAAAAPAAPPVASAYPYAKSSMKKAVETAEAPAFSTDLLRIYYQRLFPYEQMFSWLSYGHDPASDSPLVQKDFFSKREFSFTMADDIYIRYLSFRDEAAMREEIQKRQPHKIDIGAVFSHPPDKHTTIKASIFKPEQRELVFDIDLTDYDVREDTIWNGKSMSKKCWPFMAAVIKVLDASLREDFNFKNIFYVYSGRRGVHAWVCDPEAMAMTNEQRSAVADYLALEMGENHATAKKQAALHGGVLHPSLTRAFKLLEPIFVQAVCDEAGQGLLCSAEGWAQLLNFVPDEDVSRKLNAKWSRDGAATSSAEKWEELKGAVADRLDKQAGSKKARMESRKAVDTQGNLRYCVEMMVFYYLYPRLDINVSKARNHLLKSPFVVHPKTGRVCVPVDPATVDDFNPETVQSLASLVQEIDEFDATHDEKERAIPDWKKTSMVQPIETFERYFLKTFHAGIRSRFTEQREQAAASSGDW